MKDRPIISLEAIRKSTSSQSFSRGQAYYNKGALSQTVRRGNEIEGLCAGSYPEPYLVWAKLDENKIVEVDCTCQYDWGGLCKHLVALLLAYVHEPDRFEVRPALREALMARSQEQLVELIEEMLLLHPDLTHLVDRPQPGAGDSKLIDLSRMRREIRAALDSYGGWGDMTAATKVTELARTAERFARHGDWPNAVAIGCAIIEECTAQPDYPADDEGEYGMAVGQVVDSLAECLKQPVIADDAARRRAILDAMLSTLIWDINYGGIDFGGDAQDYILAYTRPEDVPHLKAQIEAARDHQRHQPYGQWGVEAYEDFLIQLDLLDNTDPEVTFTRLREEGMFLLLANKLLELGRSDEALDVVRANLEGWDLLRVLPSLTAHGLDDAAIAITEEKLRAAYDRQVVGWLLGRYHERGDLEASFRWQTEEMRRDPNILHYIALKATAGQLGRWEETRDQLRQRLLKDRRYDILLQAYLDDEEWELAWETLPRLGDSAPYRYMSFDLMVAEKTRHVMPERALPVYIKYVRKHIDQRNRESYAEAARMLWDVHAIYEQLGDEENWVTLIDGLRQEFRRLPAFQDELNKAGL